MMYLNIKMLYLIENGGDIGTALGFSYAQTRNLLTPITIHALWNSGVIVLLTILQVSYFKKNIKGNVVILCMGVVSKLLWNMKIRTRIVVKSQIEDQTCCEKSK